MKQKTKEAMGLIALILLILAALAFAWIVIKFVFLT
jgi:hypothetical protein